MNNLDKYKKDLNEFITTADLMLKDLGFRTLSEDEISKLKKDTYEILKKVKRLFEGLYQSWYTESIAVIRQLIPDRFNEFIALYETDPKRKQMNATTFSIQDWLNGIRAEHNNFMGENFFNDFDIIAMKFSTQVQILKSAQKRFDSSLFDIKQIVQAELFDTEVEASKELNKKGFHRAAGIICGVVIEKHLQQVCINHNIKISKKNPTIADLNDKLKNNNVIEITIWRFIQHLADIRNKSGHNKDQEPTTDEIEDLIKGTEKIIKTVF
ncbi:hypothetical protein ES705_18113 [subsurface metagenome]